MRGILILLAATTVLLPSIAFGRGMLGEISFNHATDDGDTQSNGVSGRYYFDRVDTGTGPLALAAFRQRADSVAMSYFDLGRGEQLSIDGRLVLKDSGWFFSAAAYKGSNFDPLQSNQSNFTLQPVGTDVQGISLEIGRYIFAETTLALAIGRTTVDSTSQFAFIPLLSLGPVTINSQSETKTDYHRLAIRHVGQWGRFTYALDADWTGLRDESNTTRVMTPPTGASSTSYSTSNSDSDNYRFGIHLFPVPSLGIDLHYQAMAARQDVEAYGIGVEWFPLPWVATSLNWQRTRYETRLLGVPVTTTTTPTGLAPSGRPNLPTFNFAGLLGGLTTGFSSSEFYFEVEAVTVGLTFRF